MSYGTSWSLDGMITLHLNGQELTAPPATAMRLALMAIKMLRGNGTEWPYTSDERERIDQEWAKERVGEDPERPAVEDVKVPDPDVDELRALLRDLRKSYKESDAVLMDLESLVEDEF